MFQKERQRPSDSHPEDRTDQTSHVNSLPIVRAVFAFSYKTPSLYGYESSVYFPPKITDQGRTMDNETMMA